MFIETIDFVFVYGRRHFDCNFLTLVKSVVFLLCRRFFILNPTGTTYKFSWSNEDSTDPARQFAGCPFRCLTPNGAIEAGKKLEIAFEYLPETMDLNESFWRFFIQDQNVSVSFLLVGMATDPAVSLDKSHLNFKELLIGNYALIHFVISICLAQIHRPKSYLCDFHPSTLCTIRIFFKTVDCL